MRRIFWPVLIAAAGAAVVTVAVPTFTIHPFRPQTTNGVAWSFALKRIAPMLTALALAVVLASAALLWSRVRGWWRRGVIVTLVALTAFATWFGRQNHFEWMFNPLARAEYVTPADARAFLVDAEIVMGIEVNGVAVAYPIRQLAYHHVVNDVIGGDALAVTY